MIEVHMTSSAVILIASDNISDAGLVKQLLSVEFNHIFISTVPENAAADFEQHQPDILILAFQNLEKSESYYLGLFGSCKTAHQKTHRTVILCKNEDIKQAYGLCKKDCFDDYVPFWPMTHDGPRLLMSAHQAQRALMANKAEAGLIAELTWPLVLVVDDDDFQQKIVGKLLEKEKYRLAFASSGEEALSIVHKNQPDLILMDIMMPDIDGIEITRRMKAIPKFANIPIIMVTGKREGTTVRDSLKAGAANFVVKPFDRNTLLAKIASALGL